MLAAPVTIAELLGRINQYIINPIIVLAFVVALLVFFWGIFEFIGSAAADKAREEGRKKIIYGVIGMLVMFSAFGIIRLIISTFGLTPPPGGTFYPNDING